jgi:hypothetical protein
MDEDNRLFVVLCRPSSGAKKDQASAFGFLSSDEFKEANDQNTIWLENWKRRAVSPINYLTIIRPPGNIELGTDFNELAEVFSSKVLEKLTYVWVTEMGEKYKSSPATKNLRYGGKVQLPNMKFRSIRIEAFPILECRLDLLTLGWPVLSETTEKVELHDIYATDRTLCIPPQGSPLSRIEITGDLTLLSKLLFLGKGRKHLEDRIEKGQLTMAIEGAAKTLQKSDIVWPKNTSTFAGTMLLELGRFFPAQTGYRSEKSNHSSSSEYPVVSPHPSDGHTLSSNRGNSGVECNDSDKCVLM